MAGNWAFGKTAKNDQFTRKLALQKKEETSVEEN